MYAPTNKPRRTGLFWARRGERGRGEMGDKWRSYAEVRPIQTGVYEWKMPSAAVEGLTVMVSARMRKRGAGGTDVISPTFDYWDGYRVLVPAGLFWRHTDLHPTMKDYDIKITGVEGLDFIDCIYCGAKPTLKACQQAYGGGVVMNAQPHRYNSWWLECCQWGRTPSLSDPRELERIRRAAIERAKGFALAAGTQRAETPTEAQGEAFQSGGFSRKAQESLDF